MWANKILINTCKNIESIFPSHCFLHLFKSLWKITIWDDNLYSDLASEFHYSGWNCFIGLCIYTDICMKKNLLTACFTYYSICEPFAGFDVVEVVSANRYFTVLSEFSKNWLLVLCAILKISTFLIFSTSWYVNISF